MCGSIGLNFLFILGIPYKSTMRVLRSRVNCLKWTNVYSIPLTSLLNHLSHHPIPRKCLLYSPLYSIQRNGPPRHKPPHPLRPRCRPSLIPQPSQPPRRSDPRLPNLARPAHPSIPASPQRWQRQQPGLGSELAAAWDQSLPTAAAAEA